MCCCLGMAGAEPQLIQVPYSSGMKSCPDTSCLTGVNDLSVRGQGNALGVVVAKVGDLNGSRHDGIDFVAMIYDVAGAGHEDVFAADEEGAQLFVGALRVAEVFEVDGGRARDLGDRRRGRGLGVARRRDGLGDSYGSGFCREDVAPGSGVNDIFALGQFVEVERGIDVVSRDALSLGSRSGSRGRGARWATSGGVGGGRCRDCCWRGSEVVVELVSADARYHCGESYNDVDLALVFCSERNGHAIRPPEMGEER